MLELTLAHKNSWLSSLMFNCPVGEEKEDCPLKSFRKFTFRERNAMISNMDDDQREKILEYHKNCMKKRGY